MAEDRNLPRRVRDAQERYERVFYDFVARHQTADGELVQIDRRLWDQARLGDDESLRAYAAVLGIDERELRRAVDEFDAAERELQAAFSESTLEGTKLWADSLKQQATFSGAALVAITTVTEALLPERLVLQPLLWASYVFLLLTLCVSLFLLHLNTWYANRVLSTGRIKTKPDNRSAYVHWATAFGLPLAVVSYVVFAVANVI